MDSEASGGVRACLLPAAFPLATIHLRYLVQLCREAGTQGAFWPRGSALFSRGGGARDRIDKPRPPLIILLIFLCALLLVC